MSTPAKKAPAKKAAAKKPAEHATAAPVTEERTAQASGTPNTPVEAPADGSPVTLHGDGSGQSLPPYDSSAVSVTYPTGASDGKATDSTSAPTATTAATQTGSSGSSDGSPLIAGNLVGTDADPATYDPSSGPITPDMTPEQRADLVARTARSEVIPPGFAPVTIVSAGTKSGGSAHSPIAELGVDRLDYVEDPDATCDFDVELVVGNLYGGRPSLTLVCTTSATGGENSYEACSDVVAVDETTTQMVHLSGVRRFVRAEYVIDGVGPAIEFSLIEPTPDAAAPGA
jgi:hypothetical protein